MEFWETCEVFSFEVTSLVGLNALWYSNINVCMYVFLYECLYVFKFAAVCIKNVVQLCDNFSASDFQDIADNKCKTWLLRSYGWIFKLHSFSKLARL